MDYEKLGVRIRSIRKRKKCTQEQISEQMGISLSFYGHIERGSRKLSMETFVDCCRVLEVTPNVLLQDAFPHAETETPESRMLQEIGEIIRRYMQP